LSAVDRCEHRQALLASAFGFPEATLDLLRRSWFVDSVVQQTIETQLARFTDLFVGVTAGPVH